VLAILTTHPIQYQVPLWRELVQRGVPLEVWYLSDHGHRTALDREFGQEFSWDIEMLGGYAHRLLETRPTNPDIGSFAVRVSGFSSSAVPQPGYYSANDQRMGSPSVIGKLHSGATEKKIPVLLRAETNDLRKSDAGQRYR